MKGAVFEDANADYVNLPSGKGGVGVGGGPPHDFIEEEDDDHDYVNLADVEVSTLFVAQPDWNRSRAMPGGPLNPP